MGAERNGNGGHLGFEAQLWAAADKLRGNMEASGYKHVVLGLIFLKCISDAFEAKREHLLRDAADPESFYYVQEEAARCAVAEGKRGGELYTPRSVVRLLVQMLEP